MYIVKTFFFFFFFSPAETDTRILLLAPIIKKKKSFSRVLSSIIYGEDSIDDCIIQAQLVCIFCWFFGCASFRRTGETRRGRDGRGHDRYDDLKAHTTRCNGRFRVYGGSSFFIQRSFSSSKTTIVLLRLLFFDIRFGCRSWMTISTGWNKWLVVLYMFQYKDRILLCLL